jgi:putative pyruvate formate lyase activating enzyme
MLCERTTMALQHYERCLLCEHRCGVNRFQRTGKCHASSTARVFPHRVECGEESFLNPCHLFYLSGCDLRCVYCINELNAFDPQRGQELTGEFLREAVRVGRSRGARTMQWVGGEPTIHLPRILEAMEQVEELPPVVWKSDFHFLIELDSTPNKGRLGANAILGVPTNGCRLWEEYCRRCRHEECRQQ